jgi:conjugal transfer pilus assembly protein TraU
LIETVKDPFCFPVMGTGMTNPKPGFSSGEIRSKEYGDSDFAFQQAHYFYFPAWSILMLARIETPPSSSMVVA